MAQYRFSPKIVSRGDGDSVIAKAAYNAREDIRDERTGEMKRHAKRIGLEFSGIFAPKNAPEWAKDRARLWNAVERREDESKRRATAQLARSLELNLPHELNAEQRRQLVRDFVREQFVRKGMIADVAIHRPHEDGDQRNYHAHILLTMREIGHDGFGDKVREWNGKELNQQWRDKWAELGARYLEKAGFAKEAERYSYAQYDLKKQRQIAFERGDLEHAHALDREATTHMGPHVAAMERRGIETERGKIQQQEFTASHELTKLKRELDQVNAQLRIEESRGAERTEPRKPQRDPQRVSQPRPPEPKRTAPELRFKDAAHQATRNTPAPNISSGIPSALRGTADTKKVIRVAHRALGKGVNLVGGTLSAFTKAFESLFAPPAPLTRAQIKEQNIRSENAARDHAEVAGKQVLFDVQQERIDNAARERADADQQREAEKWRKQQDRGGRERER
jgi:ATP-dependent exoDNAse (exonuclease V) alpha subunit